MRSERLFLLTYEIHEQLQQKYYFPNKKNFVAYFERQEEKVGVCIVTYLFTFVYKFLCYTSWPVVFFFIINISLLIRLQKQKKKFFLRSKIDYSDC